MNSPRKPPRSLIPCIICSAEFKPRSALQITCSVPCQAERRKIRVRANYTRKPETYRQYSLKYRAKDPEAVRQRNREYKAKKREAIRQRRLEYKANNLEAIRQRNREYDANNREVRRQKGRERYAKKRSEFEAARGYAAREIKVCDVCGSKYQPIGRAKTCSTECRRKRAARRARDLYHTSRERGNATRPVRK